LWPLLIVSAMEFDLLPPLSLDSRIRHLFCCSLTPLGLRQLRCPREREQFPPPCARDLDAKIEVLPDRAAQAGFAMVLR
jgi:hypothetical protein